jgi:hypothetical protein
VPDAETAADGILPDLPGGLGLQFDHLKRRDIAALQDIDRNLTSFELYDFRQRRDRVCYQRFGRQFLFNRKL